MSARQQGGQLRSILIRKIRNAGISEAMVAVLEGNGQQYTGKLSDAILARDLSKDLSISYSINKEFDIIENVVVTFRNVVRRPKYAEFVDEQLGANPDGEINASPRAIESWILAKVKNGTWKSVYGNNYRVSNNYSTRKEKRSFNKGARGGSSKQYFYPLVGGAKSKKARASLAFVIARSINENQQLKNRSRFISNPKVNIIAEFAILSALEEFNQIWLADLGAQSIQKVISIFQ
jgi:hypothetical protein